MINNINSINRVMSVIEDLRIKDNTSNKENVKKEYLANYFLPVIDDVISVVEFCRSLKLLSEEDSRLTITEFGNDFLNLNPPRPYRRYEITPAQKKYLIYRIVCCELYQQDIQDLVRKFQLNENGKLSLNNLKKDYNTVPLFNILQQLGFLYREGDYMIIKEEYENEIALYNLYSKAQSLDKFLEKKIEDAIRGSIAEYYVLDYEKNRLKIKQLKENSDKITLVSLQNVYAGYDIASFDSNESIDFDRFIEVKSSQSRRIHFFISRNEINKAKQEKDKYWIYYVEMQGRKPVKLKRFQNPIETIIKNEKEYNVEYSQLEITQK